MVRPTDMVDFTLEQEAWRQQNKSSVNPQPNTPELSLNLHLTYPDPLGREASNWKFASRINGYMPSHFFQPYLCLFYKSFHKLH